MSAREMTLTISIDDHHTIRYALQRAAHDAREDMREFSSFAQLSPMDSLGDEDREAKRILVESARSRLRDIARMLKALDDSTYKTRS